MDWTQPIETTQYLQLLTDLKNRDVDSISLCLNNPTNPITGMMKYDRARNVFQEWNGTVWTDRVLAVAGGGTGATTSPGPLGTMSTQNANAVNITGGNVTDVTFAGGTINTYGFKVTSQWPIIYLYETVAPPEHRQWEIAAVGNIFAIEAVNDATSASNRAIGISRSGYSPVKITNHVATDVIGNLSVTGIISSQQRIQCAWTFPSLTISETSAGADLKNWDMYANGNVFCLRCVNDVYNAATNFLQAFRTGYNPIGVTINRTLTVDGNSSTYIGICSRVNNTGHAGIGLVGGSNELWSGFTAYGEGHIQFRAGNPFDVLCVMDRTSFSPGGNNIRHLGYPGYEWIGVHSRGFVVYSAGSAGAPPYTFTYSGSTGMYYAGSSGSSGIGFSCDGIAMLFIDKPNNTIWIENGADLLPRIDGAQANPSNCGLSNYRWFIVHSVNGVSTVSDARLKDIKGPTRLGLNFISKLNPVEYTWITKKSKLRHGIIAQELKEVLDELEVEFDGLYEPERYTGQWGLNYSEFIAPIIKAIQELNDKVDVLRSEIHAEKATGGQ